jgi:hypothetical protein
MNLVASTTEAARVGSAASISPMIRSLSPPPVDLGRVEQGDAGVDGGVPRPLDRPMVRSAS